MPFGRLSVDCGLFNRGFFVGMTWSFDRRTLRFGRVVDGGVTNVVLQTFFVDLLWSQKEEEVML